MKNLSVKLITTTGEFENFGKEWREFEKKTGHCDFTCSYDWLLTWWNVYKDVNNVMAGYNKELKIICLYDSGNLIAIAPFVSLARKKAGMSIKIIEFLSQQLNSSFLDIIGDNLKEIQINFIFDWLKLNVKYDILFLKHIPEYSKNFRGKKLYSYSACPQIYFDRYQSYEDFTDKEYSKNLKQNLRTAFNRAKKNKDEITRTVENVTDETFNEVERISGFKTIDNKGNKYDDIIQSRFVRQIVDKLDSNICFVKLNGENVAYRLNLVYNNHYFCIDASYDRTYRRYELGALSVDISVKDCFEKKYAGHSMGPGIDLYKLKFTKELIKLFLYIEKGNTLLSPVYLSSMRKMVKKRQQHFLESINNIMKEPVIKQL